MDNLDLKQFNLACEDFIAGKYILANIKLKALINSINLNEKLTNIVSSALDGFDFGTSFKESVTSEGLVLPHDDKDVIAYCFNVLYNLDEGTITFLDFLTKYFSSSKLSGGEEFKLFASTIIQPLKTAINNEYLRLYNMTPTEDCSSNVYHKIAGVAEANLNTLDNIKLKQMEKDELKYLLNAIISASDKNDTDTIYAIMIGLDYFTKCNKRAKDIYLQLRDCFTRE